MKGVAETPEPKNGGRGDVEGSGEDAAVVGGGTGGRKVAASPATGQVHVMNQHDGTDGKS